MNLTKVNSFFPVVSQSHVALIQCSRRLYSDKNIETTKTPPPTEAPVYEKPRYATRSTYESTIKSSRVGREADADTGIRPTYTQKWFLIITRLFQNRSEIPNYVPKHTMNRMHDRMRVVYIVVAVSLVFAIFYIWELRTSHKIERDRATGKIVTKM